MTVDWGGIRVGKLRQLEVCLNEQVEYRSVTNGFLHAVIEELHICLHCWAYRMWPDCGG